MQTLMNLDNLTAIDRLTDFLSDTRTVVFWVLRSPVVRLWMGAKAPHSIPVSDPLPARSGGRDRCTYLMDERHDTLSGPVVKKLCERASQVFKRPSTSLAQISVSHLYTLRKSVPDTRKRRHFEVTTHPV